MPVRTPLNPPLPDAPWEIHQLMELIRNERCRNFLKAEVEKAANSEERDGDCFLLNPVFWEKMLKLFFEGALTRSKTKSSLQIVKKMQDSSLLLFTIMEFILVDMPKTDGDALWKYFLQASGKTTTWESGYQKALDSLKETDDRENAEANLELQRNFYRGCDPVKNVDAALQSMEKEGVPIQLFERLVKFLQTEPNSTAALCSTYALACRNEAFLPRATVSLPRMNQVPLGTTNVVFIPHFSSHIEEKDQHVIVFAVDITESVVGVYDPILYDSDKVEDYIELLEAIQEHFSMKLERPFTLRENFITFLEQTPRTYHCAFYCQEFLTQGMKQGTIDPEPSEKCRTRSWLESNRVLFAEIVRGEKKPSQVLPDLVVDSLRREF